MVQLVDPASGRQKQLRIKPTLDGRISLETVQKDSKAITSGNFSGYLKYIKFLATFG